MAKYSIMQHIPSFKAARETIKNPDTTLDNVGFQTLKRNQHQLSLIKPDNVRLPEWNSALKYHIVQSWTKKKWIQQQQKQL